MTTETADAEPLFDITTVLPQIPGAVPYQAADPAVYSTVLAGDGYHWLTALLPAPVALPCPRCQAPMRLGAVPLLWECRACDTRPSH